MTIHLRLETEIDLIYSIYKEGYESLNTLKETYNDYMKGCLSTYLNNSGKMYDIYLNEFRKIGNIVLYDFSEFTGIGSFSIDTIDRNKGYGSEVIRLLNDSVYTKDKPYLLSCESSRISFYERNGFYYSQPTEVEYLHWMTNDKNLKILDHKEIIDESGIF